MRQSKMFLVLAGLLFAAMGCTQSSESRGSLEDHEADQADGFGADGKADALSVAGNFFSARRDFRRCAYPMCGGWWVAKVNQNRTTCANGSRAAECYVADLDLTESAVSDVGATNVLFKGRIARQTIRGATWGKFFASEVWASATTDAPLGYFYRVTDNGIRCITTPCYSLHESKLNSTANREISSLTFELMGLDDAGVAPAYDALGSADGVIASGLNYWVRDGRRWGIELDATQFYVRLSGERLCGSRGVGPCNEGEFCDFAPGANCGRADHPGVCRPIPAECDEFPRQVCGCDGTTYVNRCAAEAAGVSVETDGACAADCVTAGCSGQLCVDADSAGIITTCEFRPEYACFASSTCERQADGVCGWTETAAYLECRASL